MAVGDKIYIADKETLDGVKNIVDLIKPETDKIESVKTSIGETNDSGGTNNSGSSMAKLNKLITDLTSALEKINSIDGKVGGAIKSVQTIKVDETADGGRYDPSAYIDKTINSINTNKSIVIVNRLEKYYAQPKENIDSYYDDYLGEYAEIINSTTVRCYSTRRWKTSNSSLYRSYKLYVQVIEFY